MILSLYSKRRKARENPPDVYRYDTVPQDLRVQIVHIWRDAFGEIEEMYGQNDAWRLTKWIHNALCREYGLFRLGHQGEPYFNALMNFFLQCADTDRVIDIVELSFRAIDKIVRDEPGKYSAKVSPDDAIEELNARFREHGVGFEYQSGEMIRVDSQLIHSDAIKPALQLLRSRKFEGANDEFLKAFEHYRHGRYKESLNECLKAFESTLKTICKNHHWHVDDNATAKTLIDVCLRNGLLPPFLQSQFSAVRALLESGIPTGRNKLSGHGQGADAVAVPRYFASYILHLTGTTILLLVEADEEKT